MELSMIHLPVSDLKGTLAFYRDTPGFEVAFVAPPSDIPPGRTVAFDDPSGNRTHVLDLSAGG